MRFHEHICNGEYFWVVWYIVLKGYLNIGKKKEIFQTLVLKIDKTDTGTQAFWVLIYEIFNSKIEAVVCH